MAEYILSFKPAIGNYGLHDPSAVLFKNGEPIVNTPTEAIKDFFGMGLDVLVVNDLVLEK